MAPPRLVIVHRRTELAQLLDRHATLGQAEFFLRSRGRTIAAWQRSAPLLPPIGAGPRWNGRT